MQQQNNGYTFTFVGLVAVIAALLLVVSFKALEPSINKNVEIDKKRNILAAVGIDNEQCQADILKCYKDNINEMAIDYQGKQQTDVVVDKIVMDDELVQNDKTKQRFPVFIKKDHTSGQPLNYCIPIQGKGLWSTIYGYIALEKDLNTVSGITFYKHGETPGLGAEIETNAFRKNFIGKKIYSKEGSLVSITIVKGGVRADSINKQHEVDGLSGATLTCNGVTDFLKRNLGLYESYFNLIRKGYNK